MTEEQKQALQEELLQKLKAFKPNFGLLKKCLHKRNFFRVLGLTNLETRHSNMLAWLLDSNGNHNLGDTFARSFLTSMLHDEEYKDEVDRRLKMQCDGKAPLDIDALKARVLDKFTVSRERYFIDSKKKQRYIDLLLISRDKNFPLIICIENKVFSLQHDNQLEAYYNYVSDLPGYENYYKLFFYLTPTTEYINDPAWHKISYDYVLNALEKCLDLPNIEEEVKIILTHYSDAIRRDIMDKDEELIKICVELYKQNQEEFDAVYKYTESLRDKLSNYIFEYLKKKESEFGIKLWSEKYSNWIKFTPVRLSAYNGKGPRRYGNTNFICFDIQNYNGSIACKPVLLPCKPEYDNEKKRLIENAYSGGICKNNTVANEKTLCSDVLVSAELVERFNDAFGNDEDCLKTVCKNIDSYMTQKLPRYIDVLLGK